jgi:hypothetical protein
VKEQSRAGGQLESNLGMQITGLCKDVAYLREMKKLEELMDQQAQNPGTTVQLALTHVVPVSGLFMSCFYRLENELKTVIELYSGDPSATNGECPPPPPLLSSPLLSSPLLSSLLSSLSYLSSLSLFFSHTYPHRTTKSNNTECITSTKKRRNGRNTGNSDYCNNINININCNNPNGSRRRQPNSGRRKKTLPRERITNRNWKQREIPTTKSEHGEDIFQHDWYSESENNQRDGTLFTDFASEGRGSRGSG